MSNSALVDATDPRIRYREPSRTARGGANLVGRSYLLAGDVVTVEVAWGPGAAVKNVLLRRPDGSITIRPFRGLRKIPA